MKVKFLIQPEWQGNLQDSVEAFEAEVNEWLADKKVIDVKYQLNREEKGAFVFKYLSVMVLYEETPVQTQEEK